MHTSHLRENVWLRAVVDDFLCASGSLCTRCCACFQTSGGGFHASYVTISHAHWKEINGPNGKGKSAYNGCDGHYNKKGHAVLVGDIMADVRGILGW
jgi:hypothetical protein